jgi:hypothetical protein
MTCCCVDCGGELRLDNTVHRTIALGEPLEPWEDEDRLSLERMQQVAPIVELVCIDCYLEGNCE